MRSNMFVTSGYVKYLVLAGGHLTLHLLAPSHVYWAVNKATVKGKEGRK